MTRPSGLTLDAGALIAVERGDRRLRVLLDETERAGWPIAVPVGPLAQVWRDGARQVVLARFLNATDRVEIVEWDATTTRVTGVLCGRTVTSDPEDFRVLDAQLPVIVV